VAPSAQREPRVRLGIGEWYGHVLYRMDPGARVQLAEAQARAGTRRAEFACPFASSVDLEVACNKPGGVCSMRPYAEHPDSGLARTMPGPDGRLRPVCPNRFQEAGLVRRWVASTLLGTQEPVAISEVGFLSGLVDSAEPGADVGRIDMVLLKDSKAPLEWCALEVQAVYITGPSIQADFRALRDHRGDGLPFPPAIHRLDYRSSGPKRLMPQLQIKVPTLRRWGKKMAVAVDSGFFGALSPMQAVGDVSNCDIAWFVLDILEEDDSDRAHLVRNTTHLTTLERAVEGLTAGTPVSREEFERRILAKYERSRGRSR